MNLSVITKTTNQLCGLVKKHSPEIMVAGGVVGTVVSTVLACKTTLKIDEIIDESKAKIEQIHDAVDNESYENYTEKEAKQDLTQVYIRTGLKVAKEYAPAVILGGLSIASILCSHGTMRKRNASLAAACAATETLFQRYRNNVIEEFGEDVDYRMRYGIKEVEVESTYVDENGKKKKKKETAWTQPELCYNDTSKFFDESCYNWDKSSEYNLTYLLEKQNEVNFYLSQHGHIFMNKIYEIVDQGLEPTNAGQDLGFLYENEDGTTNQVDFGIFDTAKPRARAFVNGYENVILLDFKDTNGNMPTNIRDRVFRTGSKSKSK